VGLWLAEQVPILVDIERLADHFVSRNQDYGVTSEGTKCIGG
jgi:hypothetical protein